MISTPSTAAEVVPVHDVAAQGAPQQPTTNLTMEMTEFTVDTLRDTIDVFRRARALQFLKIHGSSCSPSSEIEDALKELSLHPIAISFQRGRIQLVEAVVPQEDGTIFKLFLFNIQSRNGAENKYRYYCIRGEEAKVDFRRKEIAKWIKRDQLDA